MIDKNYQELINFFDALSHPVRIKIIGILKKERQYVSELARILKISRPLLYIHLKKLETAKIVKSSLELSDNGKAIKYYELQNFNISVTPEMLEDIALTIPLDALQNNKNLN